MAFNREQWERKIKLLQDIIVKANDGRGKGHIARVAQWIGHPSIANRVHVFADRKYFADAPMRVSRVTGVSDEGIRVDLKNSTDYVKFGEGAKWSRDERLAAAAKYYGCFADCLNPEINLIYLDDQNSPETLFLPEIAEVIGNGVKFPDICDRSPKARLVVEMETQEIDAGSTMERALKRAHYIHLSSSKEFLDRATKGHFGYRGLDYKIVEMGFLLSDGVRKTIDGVLGDRGKFRDRAFEEFGSNCENYVYSSFGAAEGADKLYDLLLNAATERKEDTLFVVANMKKVKDVIVKMGKSVKPVAMDAKDNAVKWKVEGFDNFYIVENQSGEEHHTRLASADIAMLGCGSSTTYEGVYAGNPMICLPLERPGYEQIIKAAGVVNCGGGEAFFADELIGNNGTREYLSSIGFNPRALNSHDLSETIKHLSRNSTDYKRNLTTMRKYFKKEEDVARSMAEIANSNTF